MIFERFIDKLYASFEKGKPLFKSALDLSYGVSFYMDFLFEKVCHVFEWQGLPFAQKHLENTLLLNGYVGVVFDEKYGAWVAPENGSLTGVTPYTDEFTDFVYAAPKCEGGTVKIFPYYKSGEAVIIDNTTNRLSILPLIRRYAELLAHADITVKDVSILMRYDSILSGTTDATVENLKRWRKAIETGETHLPVLDKQLTNAPLVYPSGSNNKGQMLLDAIDARNEIVRQFLAEIGIRQNKEKRGNMVAGEVTQNDMSLLFNVSDMLKNRERGASILQDFSEDFSGVTVTLSPEYELITTPFDGDN